MKKRKYLYRLAMSILLIVLLPLLIATIYFGKYSYDKVETTSEEYASTDILIKNFSHNGGAVKGHRA